MAPKIRTKKKDGYSTGRAAELSALRTLKPILKATKYQRTRGSRTPADGTLWTQTKRKYMIQSKKATAKSTFNGKCSAEDDMKLSKYARQNEAIPISVCGKGNTSYAYYTNSRKMIYAKVNGKVIKILERINA